MTISLFHNLQHFAAFYEDQFDFHSYCIRKMTLCSYMKILRFEDTLRNHRYYLEAAKLAASVSPVDGVSGG